MEKFMGFDANDEAIELPPGFRFHPTDEELITHYLSPKVVDRSFRTKAIGEVDLQRVEPWDLPWKAKMGEKEWYFFCVKDWKYPTGMRTNRATDAGYWKATGKDKEIFGDKSLVGMKKTLVFYRGRAPRGERTNWVMHEYRLEGKHSMHSLPRTARPGWVICRVFKKSSGGKKVHVSGLAGSTNCGAGSRSLMDFSSDEIHTISRGKLVDEFCSSSKNRGFSAFPSIFPDNCSKSSMFSSRIIPCSENSDRPDSVLMQDRSTERILMEDNAKTDFLQGVCSDMSCREVKFRPCESQEFPILSSLPLELEYSWNY